MRTLRRHRRWLVPWLAAALLWAQWLTAAYACPQLQAAGGDGLVIAASFDAASLPQADAADIADAAGISTHCAEHGPAAMDPEQPQLCKAHCQAGQQTVNSQAGAFDAPPLALAGWVGDIAVAEPAAAPRAAVAAQGLGPPRGTPPLYLSLRVLRN